MLSTTYFGNRVLGIFAAAFAVNCTRSSSLPDAAVDAAPVYVQGPHAPIPQIPNQGGGVFAHVKLITINFADDPHEAELSRFGDWVVTSNWWHSVGSEYGVGPGTHQHVHLTAKAPAHVGNSGPTDFITAKLADGTLPSGAEYLYMVFYPPQTVVDLAIPCAGFKDMNSQAYHEAMDGPPSYSYAVVPSCSKESIARIEIGAAHELIEAATDPVPSSPTYQFPETSPQFPATSAWVGEVADQCDGPYSEAGFYAPTSWSNAAVAAGTDPCVPAPLGPFFDASMTPDTITVAAGGSVEFEVEGWSTAPVDDWQVRAESYPGFPYGFTAQVSLDVATLNNNRRAKLTATAPPGASTGDVSTIYLVSQNGQISHYWPAMITVQ